MRESLFYRIFGIILFIFNKKRDSDSVARISESAVPYHTALAPGTTASPTFLVMGHVFILSHGLTAFLLRPAQGSLRCLRRVTCYMATWLELSSSEPVPGPTSLSLPHYGIRSRGNGRRLMASEVATEASYSNSHGGMPSLMLDGPKPHRIRNISCPRPGVSENSLTRTRVTFCPSYVPWHQKNLISFPIL